MGIFAGFDWLDSLPKYAEPQGAEYFMGCSAVLSPGRLDLIVIDPRESEGDCGGLASPRLVRSFRLAEDQGKPPLGGNGSEEAVDIDCRLIDVALDEVGRGGEGRDALSMSARGGVPGFRVARRQICARGFIVHGFKLFQQMFHEHLAQGVFGKVRYRNGLLRQWFLLALKAGFQHARRAVASGCGRGA